MQLQVALALPTLNAGEYINQVEGKPKKIYLHVLWQRPQEIQVLQSDVLSSLCPWTGHSTYAPSHPYRALQAVTNHERRKEAFEVARCPDCGEQDAN